jgi:hypothetical protein
MKLRPDSSLAQFNQDQLDQIYDWLTEHTYREVLQFVAKPPPEGFGVTLHKTTLVRFYRAERRRRHAEALAQTRFHDAPSDDPEILLQNIKVELAHTCYDLADHADSASINSLSRITHRFEVIKLEQQRLTLEREFLAEKKRQFNYNAAREAAKHAVKIHKIIEAPTPDAEDKTWMVSEIVFGSAPGQEKLASGIAGPASPYSTNIPSTQNAP